jgi:predicted  nucleic acid-binding Zn-ribbon protein
MTRRPIDRLCRAAVPTLVAALCLGIPSAWAQKAGEKAGEDRKAFRESVLGIRGQIDTTLKALNDVAQGKDVSARKSALKKYSNEIKAMDKQIEKTKSYSQKMKERGQDYFKEWEKSMKGVTNPALQASATQRRDTLKAQYEKIESSISQAKADSSKFWKDLQDLEKFYTNDLSDSAISTTADLVKSANSDGKKIQGYIDDVVKAVDQVGTVVEQPQAATPEEKPQEAAPAEEKPAEEAPGEEPPQETKPPEDKPPVFGTLFR